ncbi:hypothetical protein [Streptomyces sp. NRRL F-5630]|uniref:hypothetical protein n=1 Tax=Streptomyces sp. NRRL F-5630 TaxID=1463864 RepID=UPI003EB72396
MSRKRDRNQGDNDMMNVPGRLARLRVNFDRVAADDPTAVVLDTDDLTPGELAATITDHLTETST